MAIEFDVLKELFQALFAVLMLDEDIDASDLFNASHALDPEQ